jgi:AcrR family transcriptional regulator
MIMRESSYFQYSRFPGASALPSKSANTLRRQAKQSRSKDTVDAILAGAVQVLVSQGYGHSTTERIAHRAGVSIGTLYQYFGGKGFVEEGLAFCFHLVTPVHPLDGLLRAQRDQHSDHDGPDLLQELADAMPGLRFVGVHA